MSNHLKVELRRLKRSLDGGYGFDLTRYCAGCWTRLGRIFSRGLCCDSCGKRVCKTCRHFVDARLWICVLCYKKKYSRERWWHDDANVQKFKGVQGKTGTYLLRLTDWSAHGILDTNAADDTLGRRIHSFCEGSSNTPFREASTINWRIFKSRSEIYPISSVQDIRKKLKTDKNFEQKWKLMFSNDEDVREDQQNNRKYTSVTLKQRRRETRKEEELDRMSQASGFARQNEFRKSRRQRTPSFKASGRTKKHQSSLKRTETHARQLDPDESESSLKTKEDNGGTWRRKEPRIRKLDYYNFLPEAAFLNRNDYDTRLSLRGTRVFGRRKSSSRAFPGLEGYIREGGSNLKCRSISLPCDLQQPEFHDYEFWNAGFVQSRVRRLEEDLNTKWEDRYNPRNYDFEVQSLCSLDFGRILPDGDDYRIAYLSSIGTSLESSLDYMDDSIGAFTTGTLDYRVDKQSDKDDNPDNLGNGMGTLDVKLTKKKAISKSEDWDLSFSSTENKGLSSEEDDEFEFVRITNENENNHSLTFPNENLTGDAFLKETEDICSKNLKNIATLTNNKSNFSFVNSEELFQELNDSISSKKDECMKETAIQSQHSQEEICTKTTNSRNEEIEKEKYLHDINKSFIPPKIWYEIRDPVDPKKLSRTHSHDLSQRFKNQNFKSNTWHKKMSKPLIKSNSFCFERNMSCDELYALADSTRSKINELFNYEPLSTPFAEIYAIECGKYSSKTLCNTDEENNYKTNILSDDYSTMTDNQTKHESDLEKLMNCSSVSDPECFASNIIPNTNKVEESKSYQSSSTIGSKGNDNNKANENHTCSNLNTFGEIKNNSLLKRDHFLTNIYDISSFIRQINYFPSLKKELSDGSYKNLSHNSLSYTNQPESAYKIQIFRLEDKHRNDQPIIRSCFRKSPFYCFFQSEENLKWAINTFVNDIRHSRELKHLIQVFINHLRRMSNTGTPIRQVESRNQNRSSARSDQHIETEVVSAGEIVESGFASCVTSQTSRAAFVEYSFPPHSSCTRGSECFLSCTCSVPRLTVPAVQERLVVERESCSPSQWAAAVVALCSLTTDGESSTTNVYNRNSTWIQNNHNIILDYTIDTSAWRVDYNNEDYERFGSLPSGLALLIVGGICNGAATGFRRIMATTDDDPRSLGRVVRTQGKNISKLMRLFDSNERTITYSSESVNFSSKSGDNRTKSCSIASQSVTEQQYSNEISNSKAIQNEASVVSEYTMKDSQSSAAFSKTNEVTVNNAVNSERSCNGENLSSEIPYCRKVSKNGLWENVNIGTKNDSKGLWNSVQNSNQADDLEQAPNSLLASTAELNDLIASSRAELSKKKEPSVSDKSNLENYFTSFENSKPAKCQLSSDMENSFASSDSNQYHNSEIFHPYLSSPYICDINGMNFEDEEAMLSDTSSEEDMKCHPGMTNTNYLPAYALHTIIEESCEESERDSRTTTPTNDAVTSKLERYFSWDIINDTNRDLRKKSDDESTIYSDSLSESSNSLSNDEPKDIDPTHLASSRLEKYFTSGLVDDQNCYYPDDAEFLDDAPISDFEEDTVHQKISRSALLSSLETKKVISHQVNLYTEPQEFSNTESTNKFSNKQDNTESLIENDVNNDKFEYDCDRTSTPILSLTENTQTSSRISEKVVSSENSEQTYPVDQIDSKLISESEEIIISNNIESVSEIGAVAPSVQTSEKVSETENSFPENENSMNKEENLSCSPKPTVNKDQLTSDIQAIIKKLVSYFTTETGSESFKKNIETNYVSAWHILETEIERLLQSISPNAIENNSCNSSTIDSNNSDYGSDTIESMDCITDDDDIDSKNRSDGKCPLVDILSSAYKFQSSNSELSSFNISDETLSIWKRLIQSLQKDNSVLSENKCDPNAEARLYIRDQIVTLMHTVTVNDNVHENEKLPSTYNSETKEISQSLIEVNDYPDQINEAFNVNVGSSNLLAHLTESDRLDSVIISKTESSDEGISDISTDAINVTSQITVFQDEFIQINERASTDTVTTSIETNTSDKSSAISCEPLCITDDLEKAPDNLENEKSDPNHQDKDKIIFSSKETLKKDNDLKFSVVEIALSDESKYVSEDNAIELDENITCAPPENFQTNDTNCEIDSSPLNRSHNHPDPSTSPLSVRIKDSLRSHKRLNPEASRDTGYYSFKSSDDSIINTTSSSAEFVDVPNFKSLKRTVKKFPVSNTTLSKSTNNILQSFSSSPDAKFSTLQLKSKKSKNSSNATNSPRQFTALFSPSAVLKRFTGSKSSETPNPESSIPQKYLKKYARSISTDNDSLFGAASMPQLNSPRGQGDSYSALGLYAENDKDSSLILDDDGDVKRYFSGSQSALSLGAHSASMTSVYSAAGCHYGFVTVSGDVLFGLNYNQKSQMMEVFIKECRNLAAIDVRHNKSNPYVKVYLLPDKTRSGKRKTKTKKNTVNPVFNELLRFPVLKSELESRTLWLSVWNSDLFGRNDFLGEISLPLGYRLLDSPTLRWYPLQDRVESLPTPLQCKGELFIALKYVPRDLSLESRFRPAPVISLRGALHVLVKEARNISPLRSSMDAFCKSYLLPDKSKTAKQKTPVVRKSNHPKWYYTVIYEDLSIEELKERSLELTVWDHDKITRNNFVGGVRLNVGTGLYHGVPVDWMDSRRDESGLWLSMLDSPNMWVDGSLPLRPTMHTQGTGLFS